MRSRRSTGSSRRPRSASPASPPGTAGSGRSRTRRAGSRPRPARTAGSGTGRLRSSRYARRRAGHPQRLAGERGVVDPEQACSTLPRERARHGRGAVAILDRPPRGGPEEALTRRPYRYRIPQADHGGQLVEQAEVLLRPLREPEPRVHHDTLVRYTRVLSPPTSSSSHPSATSRSACATARSAVKKRPPSEKESGVTFTIPISTGWSRASVRPAISQRRGGSA